MLKRCLFAVFLLTGCSEEDNPKDIHDDHLVGDTLMESGGAKEVNKVNLAGNSVSQERGTLELYIKTYRSIPTDELDKVAILSFDEDGNLISEMKESYADGDLDSLTSSYHALYNSDGEALSRSFYYYDEGVISRSLEYKKTFNVDGVLLKNSKYIDGVLDGFSIYNDQGDLLQSVSNAGAVNNEYDSARNLLKRTVVNDERTTISHYKYNKNGQVIYTSFDKDGAGEVYYDITYSYDENHNLISEKKDIIDINSGLDMNNFFGCETLMQCMNDPTFREWDKRFTYNALNLLVQSESFDVSGRLIEDAHYTYHENNLLKKRSVDGKWGVVESIYNSLGKLTQENIDKNSDGLFDGSTSILYHDNGEITHKVEDSNGNGVSDSYVRWVFDGSSRLMMKLSDRDGDEGPNPMIIEEEYTYNNDGLVTMSVVNQFYSLLVSEYIYNANGQVLSEHSYHKPLVFDGRVIQSSMGDEFKQYGYNEGLLISYNQTSSDEARSYSKEIRYEGDLTILKDIDVYSYLR